MNMKDWSSIKITCPTLILVLCGFSVQRSQHSELSNTSFNRPEWEKMVFLGKIFAIERLNHIKMPKHLFAHIMKIMVFRLGMAKVLQLLNMDFWDLKSRYKGFSEVNSWIEISRKYRYLDFFFALPVPAELSFTKTGNHNHFLLDNISWRVGEKDLKIPKQIQEKTLYQQKLLRDDWFWGKSEIKCYISWELFNVL